MKKGWFKYAGAVFLAIFFGFLFLLIPSLRLQTYLSPDETAVAVAARQFGSYGTLRLEDQLLKQYPWLHPRSLVTQGAALVPVGFLGSPLLFGSLWRLFGDYALLFFTPLLALSAIYPLWRFTRRLGFTGQLATMATWLTFPTVILYANRGLFPNLIVTCLGLWSAYLIWEKRTLPRTVVAGILVGAAVAIRPTEAAWLAAWLAAAYLTAQEAQQAKTKALDWISFFVAAAILPIFAFIMAWKTYGSPWVVGYFLHDPVISQGSAAGAAFQTVGWPFGLHPRAMWNNFWSYIVILLGPWFATAAAAVFYAIKRKQGKYVAAAGVWTLFVLCLIYGQGLYQDHVGVNVVSIGNSFLRYILPLTPFLAFSSGAVCCWLFQALPQQHAAALGVLLVGILAILGTWSALARDDEGLNTSIPELQRYNAIRQEVVSNYADTAVVLSDRSDKIFFPDVRAVSPMPDKDRFQKFVTDYPYMVLYFGTTADDAQIQQWQHQGLLMDPVLQTDNQTLYEVNSVGNSTADAI